MRVTGSDGEKLDAVRHVETATALFGERGRLKSATGLRSLPGPHVDQHYQY
jgi:hypothetical protein